MSCTCGELKIDGRGTGSFDWNPDCAEHGTTSGWYNSDEQKNKRAKQSQRLRELQSLAAERRREAQQ